MAWDESASADDLRRRGWTIVPSEIPARLLDDLVSEPGGEFGLGSPEASWPGLLHRAPRLAAHFGEGPILRTVAAVAGSELAVAMNYLHVKPAGTAAHTVPHRDIAHLSGLPDCRGTGLMFKVAIALDHVEPGGGGVLLSSGSHLLTARALPPVEPSLRKGEALLFNAAILHSSSANMSSYPRWTAWFALAQNWMRVMPGHEIDPARLEQSLSPRLKRLFGEDPTAYSTERKVLS